MFPALIRGKVIQGTCGWTDESLKSCNRFYPLSARSSTEKLGHYSRGGGLGCVEVDSSTYAIPAVNIVKGWIDATPPGFTFHFKAFSALCMQKLDITKYPRHVRELCNTESGLFMVRDLPDQAQQALWNQFNESLIPAFDGHKMGCVVFQFHLDFSPSSGTCKDYLQYLSERLDPRYRIAIEFRNRAWIVPERLEETLTLLRGLRPEGVALIASDDLESELYASRDYSNLSLGSYKMPLVLNTMSCGHFAYIRIHRREGAHRVLKADEIEEWANLIDGVLPEGVTDNGAFTGPIFVLWGTDYEDQGIVNSRNLFNRLPARLQLDWKQHTKSMVGGVLHAFQKKMKSPESVESLRASEIILSAYRNELTACPEVSTVEESIPDTESRSLLLPEGVRKEIDISGCDTESVPLSAGKREITQILNSSEIGDKPIKFRGIEASSRIPDSKSPAQPRKEEGKTLLNYFQKK
jgi:uncharacterized protein YecE (DUF72 family)